ncbi:MAG: DNA double-strand break repair nuclease NurA [Nitrososphaerota archaeon]
MTIDSNTTRILSRHLNFLVKLFEERLSYISNSGFNFSFIFSKIDMDLLKNFAKNFFSLGEFKIFGIDGSMAKEEYLEVLLLYVCSLGYYGKLKVNDENIEVNIQDIEREKLLSLTASIPLWIEDLPNVNPQSSLDSKDYEINRSIESIAYALMRLSELTLTYRVLQRQDVKVILMDGLISGAYGPLMRDFRLLMRGTSVFEGFKTPYGKIDKTDLLLAGNLGPYSFFIPNRSVFSKYKLLKYLLDINGNEWISINEIKSKYDGFDQAYRSLKRLNKILNGNLLEFKNEEKYIRVRPELFNYWDKIWWATCYLTNKIFEEKEEYPFLINNDRWITVLDISTMNLFTLYNLLNEAIKRKILVIGIAKDISATDFIRSIFPIILYLQGINNDFEEFPRLQSDKAFLTMLSTINYDKIKTPWRTLEYDYCFATTLSHIKNKELNIRAARKIIGKEQMFVKSYFQLRSSDKDSSMRSPVFCYDRPIYSEYDKNLLKTFDAYDHRGLNKIFPLMEFKDLSLIGNLVLYILSLSDNPHIIEEAGHNHLLFLADKYVKIMSKQAKEMLKGVASLGLGGIVNKYKAYFITKRFRDIRAEAEKLREKYG